ncbi:hypothetical protein [Nakamurella panacisegetis]|uniref:hypothetical protein n=1 Tax=Nakamurella panacisegetis TaxID=1090615 RepID=UPI0012FD99EE|nr:hypothetical protein [Nakamurella panacisegetis]
MRSALFLSAAVIAATLIPIGALASVPTPTVQAASTPATVAPVHLDAKAVAAAAAPAPTRSRTFSGGYLQGTLRTKLSAEAFSSSVVGNLTGHTDGDVDVVAAYLDGSVHIWSARTGRQEFVIQTGSAIRASPALVRLRAGGGYMLLLANDAGTVYMYGWVNHQPHLVFRKSVPRSTHRPGIFGTPTLANLDNNGKMYVVVSSFDQHLYVWDLAGNNKKGFPYFAQDTIWSSPTVTKVDGDAYPRIIFGYDCGGSGAQTCYQKWHTHGGVLTSLRHDGSTAPGWPQLIPGQVVWSTPAVASLYGGTKKQIIVGTGLFYSNAGYATYVFDSSGHRLMTVPMHGRTFSSPAIGDVMGTGSGAPQIVIGDEFGHTDIIDGKGHRLVDVCTAKLNTCVMSHSSPIIGDLYGNGHQEVVAVGGNTFSIIDHTGRITNTVQIKETALGLAASPTLVNIDGKATLFFTLMAKSAGGNQAEVVSYTFPTRAGASAWPMFKGNTQRSGASGKVVPNA